MTTPRKEPLDPQEREWADRLARLGPHGDPPTGVDAAILAAAHAAANPGRRKPKRWPAMAGLAAMLALAVGVTWQLRPTQELPATAGEGPATAAEGVAIKPAEPAPAPALYEALPAPPPEPAPATPPPPVAKPAAPPSSAAPPPPPPVVAPAPPAPPAPPSPAAAAPREASRLQSEVRAVPEGISDPAPMDIDRESASTDAAEATASASRQRLSRSAPAAAEATAARAEPIEDRGLTVDDLPIEADLGLAPEVWIERIRQRRERGNLEQARRSLDALREAHPDIELPPDLATLRRATDPGR
ncbi:hypothetical protein [Novilysobacter spongiicola]|uniref:Meckel syndrome type 1 protein n=1 Tax=Lysobacter spongiicola DSM 21749 TaxID=1122188 RepID=A0A1T4NTM0_9GAMM|nr:hypothetical protein [Lysobacter spongiicola]SJZ82619.1 hypothetical protein SAMN02745674_00904 [Lysobacter spongiicola DSM 21749]